jgi:hypothetical protein
VLYRYSRVATFLSESLLLWYPILLTLSRFTLYPFPQCITTHITPVPSLLKLYLLSSMYHYLLTLHVFHIAHVCFPQCTTTHNTPVPSLLTLHLLSSLYHYSNETPFLNIHTCMRPLSSLDHYFHDTPFLARSLLSWHPFPHNITNFMISLSSLFH